MPLDSLMLLPLTPAVTEFSKATDESVRVAGHSCQTANHYPAHILLAGAKHVLGFPHFPGLVLIGCEQLQHKNDT